MDFAFVLLLALAFICYSEAVCCGRGQHGYCKDCEVVGLFKKRKCCGAGSGHGNGCNLFCCNCGGGACRTGTSIITGNSGWWLGKHYTCIAIHGDDKVGDVGNDLRQTKMIFSSMDTNADKSLNLNEFAEGLRQHFNQDLHRALTSELQYDRERRHEMALLDTAEILDSLDDYTANDIASMVRREFTKMDANGDRAIQAMEFDRDL